MKNRVAQVQGFVFGVSVMVVFLVIFPLVMLQQGAMDYDGDTEWKMVTIGGVVTFEVPETCNLDAGAGTAYLVCPTEENPTPTPEMTFSSDGETVNVRRWENLETPYWDHIVSSMTVVQPMTHDITINIQE